MNIKKIILSALLCVMPSMQAGITDVFKIITGATFVVGGGIFGLKGYEEYNKQNRMIKKVGDGVKKVNKELGKLTDNIAGGNFKKDDFEDALLEAGNGFADFFKNNGKTIAYGIGTVSSVIIGFKLIKSGW